MSDRNVNPKVTYIFVYGFISIYFHSIYINVPFSKYHFQALNTRSKKIANPCYNFYTLPPQLVISIRNANSLLI